MEHILLMAQNLGDALGSSPLYENYLKAKKVVDETPSLYYKLDQFKRTQLDFESKSLKGINTDFGEEQYLSKLYSELMLNETAKMFLMCERELIGLIKEINTIILGSCKMDISFLERD